MLNIEKFKNPDPIYRSAPFWALNGHLESEELKRQIREFKKQGIGGAFLHPRGGLSTKYLSAEFFDAIRACIEELEKLDMIAWLYDEDRFPSGVAGGMVLKKNPEFSQKCIVPTVIDTENFAKSEDVLAVYSLEDHSYRRIDSESVLPSGKVLAISLTQTHKSVRYNHESYVDVLNKEAIDTFIEITHEQYYKNFKEYFGNIIPAIFTDEPNFRNSIKGSLPWTCNLESKFMAKYGYDLLNHLPDLFFDFKGCEKARFDYWDLISSLFVEAFSKNIYDWCEEKGIAYTGHFWEHVFPSPLHTGSVMPHYEYMHYPGIDMLFIADSKSPHQYGNDLIVKEASSVANQLGKRRVLSETHGASGWGLDFRYQKRATDWQLAQGINLFSQHLSLYSMEGYRKRDFPQSFLDHQPWWDDYKMLGDYMGRLSYALSQGEYMADVLVLHPSSSTWALFGALEESEELKNLESSVKNLVKTLNQNRIMFDLGDDIILSKHGEIKNSKLRVGNMNYSVVILPDMTIMRKEVYRLLKEFKKAGGKIIATGRTPSLLDGIYSEELVAFFSCLDIIKADSGISLFHTLELLRVENIKLREKEQKDLSNIYGHIRQQGFFKTIFLCNLDMDQRVNLEMELDKPCFTWQFNTETGECEPCTVYSNEKGQYYLSFSLESLNSILFLVDETKRVSSITVLKEDTSKSDGFKKVLLLSNWTVKTLEPNAINLQYCRAAINNESYKDIDDVLVIDDQLKDRLGLERGNIFMKQPWMYTQEEISDTHNVRAQYHFTVENIPSGDVLAAVELPQIFKVFINDKEVSPSNSYYKDRAFVLYNIKPFIKKGDNVVRLESSQYGVLVNLESIYIVGDFKVIAGGKKPCIGEPDPLTTGNLTTQGYPYYSGKVAYTTDFHIQSDFDEAMLFFDNFDGVTASIIVNGNKIRTLGWKPYSVDLTRHLKKGLNTLTIEIANSLQNLLGPFAKDANLNLVTPFSFYADKHENFLPVGFDGKAEIRMK